VATRLAEQAQATSVAADDRPVLDDLGQLPRRSQPGRGSTQDSGERGRPGAARTTARRIAERYRGARRPAPVHDDKREGADPEYSWPAPEPKLRGRPRDAYREPEPPRREFRYRALRGASGANLVPDGAHGVRCGDARAQRRQSGVSVRNESPGAM